MIKYLKFGIMTRCEYKILHWTSGLSLTKMQIDIFMLVERV